MYSYVPCRGRQFLSLQRCSPLCGVWRAETWGFRLSVQWILLCSLACLRQRFDSSYWFCFFLSDAQKFHNDSFLVSGRGAASLIQCSAFVGCCMLPVMPSMMPVHGHTFCWQTGASQHRCESIRGFYLIGCLFVGILLLFVVVWSVNIQSNTDFP